MKTIHGGKITDTGAGISLTSLKPFQGYPAESLNSAERGRKGDCQKKTWLLEFNDFLVVFCHGVYFGGGCVRCLCPMTASCLDG